MCREECVQLKDAMPSQHELNVSKLFVFLAREKKFGCKNVDMRGKYAGVASMTDMNF